MSAPERTELSFVRALPSSHESEVAILGAILIDGAVISQAVEHLIPNDFYSPLNRTIFGSMISLLQQQKVIDPITIGEDLKKQGGLIEDFGGIGIITNLTFGLPHTSDVAEYIKIVKDKAKARELIRACDQISRQTIKEEEPIEITLDRAEQMIFNLTTVRGNTSEEHIHPLAVQALGEKAAQMRDNVTVAGMTTGLRDLDKQIGGYQKQQFIVLGGRPSMGKTGLITKSIMDGLIVDPGAVGIFFSAEMSKREIISRIICQYADTNLWRFNHNHIRETEWRHILNIVAPFQGINFYIDDTPGISVTQMLAKARRIQAKHKRLDIVAVDHMGLMTPPNTRDTRVNQLTQISGGLKTFAKIMDVPTIALSQLSRDVEKRNPPIPEARDVRDSGSIEQDADVLLFVYRPAYYNRKRGERPAMAEEAQIIVAKQRNGPTDTVQVRWISGCAKFINFDLEEIAQPSL